MEIDGFSEVIHDDEWTVVEPSKYISGKQDHSEDTSSSLTKSETLDRVTKNEGGCENHFTDESRSEPSDIDNTTYGETSSAINTEVKVEYQYGEVQQRISPTISYDAVEEEVSAILNDIVSQNSFDSDASVTPVPTSFNEVGYVNGTPIPLSYASNEHIIVEQFSDNTPAFSSSVIAPKAVSVVNLSRPPRNKEDRHAKLDELESGEHASRDTVVAVEPERLREQTLHRLESEKQEKRVKALNRKLKMLLLLHPNTPPSVSHQEEFLDTAEFQQFESVQLALSQLIADFEAWRPVIDTERAERGYEELDERITSLQRDHTIHPVVGEMASPSILRIRSTSSDHVEASSAGRSPPVALSLPGSLVTIEIDGSDRRRMSTDKFCQQLSPVPEGSPTDDQNTSVTVSPSVPSVVGGNSRSGANSPSEANRQRARSRSWSDTFREKRATPTPPGVVTVGSSDSAFEGPGLCISVGSVPPMIGGGSKPGTPVQTRRRTVSKSNVIIGHDEEEQIVHETNVNSSFVHIESPVSAKRKTAAQKPPPAAAESVAKPPAAATGNSMRNDQSHEARVVQSDKSSNGCCTVS